MSDLSIPSENDPTFAELESLIFRAGSYVRPSDNLRPKVLEESREAFRQQCFTRRLSSLAAVVVFFLTAGFPDALTSSHLGPAFVESNELHRRASVSAIEPGIGTNWALYEVFSELRRDQATLLQPAE